MITAYLIGDEQVLSRLRGLPDAIGSSCARAITKLGIALQQRVQQDKLSGQVLMDRTGALRSSINLQIDQSAGRVTATVFSDCDYAHAQEYGFSGTVNVRASLRRIREAFGRPIAEKTISVRAQSRRMHLAEHSFLRSALEDMTPEIQDEVDAAMRETVTQ
jgi:Bacteriophage HK97-gp10, putative tail-component